MDRGLGHGTRRRHGTTALFFSYCIVADGQNIRGGFTCGAAVWGSFLCAVSIAHAAAAPFNTLRARYTHRCDAVYIHNRRRFCGTPPLSDIMVLAYMSLQTFPVTPR